MLDRAAIAALIPHQGAMCLLDGVRAWSDAGLTAFSRSHLDPGNPLRRDGQLAMVCGCEYAFQAAALHGALAAGGARQPAGRVVKLDLSRLAAGRLDDPDQGPLAISVELDHADAAGLAYRFAVAGQGGCLLEGRGVILLPASP